MDIKKSGFWNWLTTYDSPPPQQTQEEIDKMTERRLKADRLENERNRKNFEKYKLKKVGGWGCLPALALFLISLWSLFAILWEKNLSVYYLIPIGLLYWFWIVAIAVENDWDARLECKKEIYSPYGADAWRREYKWRPELYSDDYIYTDSLRDVIVHRLWQGIAYLATIGVAIPLAFYLFFDVAPRIINGLSLKAIGIIIIILLLIVISNQKQIKQILSQADGGRY